LDAYTDMLNILIPYVPFTISLVYSAYLRDGCKIRSNLLHRYYTPA